MSLRNELRQLEVKAEGLTVEIGRWNRQVVDTLTRAKQEQDWSLVDEVIDAANRAEEGYIAAQLFETGGSHDQRHG